MADMWELRTDVVDALEAMDWSQLEFGYAPSSEEMADAVMPIVWQTLRNLVLRATQAPFKFIAGLAGGGDDTDLSQIGFAAGSAELDEEAINALGALAAALKERPNLIVEVEGQSAVENDAPLLAMARLEREYQQEVYDELKRRNKTLPEDPAELVIEEDDKARLLREIYTERLQLSVPESWQELPQDERDQQMQQALVANWSDNPLPLRRLAQQRAAGIKAWLVDHGELEAERVHLLDVNSNTAPINDKVPTALQLGVQ